jgi:cytoplasmic iron level regulating protein YaaA (DUF328/UPF0246 family)
MIFVISPAKRLDFDTPPVARAFTQPDFLHEAGELIRILRRKSPADVAKLMGLSDRLAALNVARYESWASPFTPGNAKQAVLAFDGDVYDGLDAGSLSDDELDWAQRHLRILSGLYGLLRPLDLMQPYRLEMGTRLANPKGTTLQAYWRDTLTDALNRVLGAERDAGRAPVLVNLASMEYFNAVKPAQLIAPVVTPLFEEWTGGRYKLVAYYAKRARGRMCRYAIRNRVDDVEGLKGFDYDGYAFAANVSNRDTPVFRRRTD